MTELLYHPETVDYADVAMADPLQLDERLHDLPQKNATEDVYGLQDDLDYASATLAAREISSLSTIDAYATIRDLDFLTSSLVRHGINPITSTPGLEAQLLELGDRLATAPRGTVYTYAACNPEGARERSFTGSPEEALFIRVVRDSSAKLDVGALTLSTITPASTPETICQALDTVNAACDEMTASIVAVHRNLSPEYFTNHMRPFFDPLTIGGETYTGSGGAQLQLLAIDHMLWGIDEPDPAYREFYDENYQYLTPQQREALRLFGDSNGDVSLVSTADQLQDANVNQALATTMRRIRRFRYPHKKVAEDNFKLRGESAVGSGAYRPDILGHLIMKTEAHLNQLEQGSED